ncbi:MAG: MBL fold metallo-hydrolase [Bacteroidales bacterium]|nr:MBL fold metallo-hydrolase [Bacteroidales bacterium]
MNSELKIKCLPVNPIEMNLYVVYRKGGEGVIIDPGCSTDSEFQRLFDFVEQEKIQITHILLTHPHFDHMMGAARICREYNLPLELHEEAVEMLDTTVQSTAAFGLPPIEKPQNLKPFRHRDTIAFADTHIEVRHTPGHCQGSVSFVLPELKSVFTGDALFHGSIGRTDFPTGDYDLLKKSIFEQLFVLDEDYQVRSGHGGRTTIEQEKYNNPFL